MLKIEAENYNELRGLSPDECTNGAIIAAISETQIISGHMGNIPPPTYFKLNDFTAPFQQIISTYGVPKYKEVNPAYFSIVTFPFLFGIMFGDIGHGLFMFTFGLFLCSRSSLFDKYYILKTFQPARYLILLMGFFSFFSGLIYNDFLSVPLELFPSCYQRGSSNAYILKEDCTYGFGIDHTWYNAGNHLDFMNSMKMKLSVIIGVSHMTLGVIMKAINSKYFHKKVDLFFEFIPQLILLLVTFGYMNFLIIVKWLTYFENTSRAPSIIATMIDMMLGYGAVKQTPLLYSQESQRMLSLLIIVAIFLSVPTMLLVKPLIITQQINLNSSQKHQGLIELGVCKVKKRKLSDPPSDNEEKSNSDDENGVLIKKKSEIKKRFQNSDDEDRREAKYNPSEDPYAIVEEKKDEAREKLIKVTKPYQDSNSHNIQEIWIHQLIETVEFVLGTVSNTASYLRLWALSLAHSQLAAVFYDKMLKDEIEQSRWFMVCLILPLFLAAHFFILLCMSSMECFLHTLRLHWVEFQNKFFKGTGYRFIIENNYIFALF